jgi:YfiH family protein
VDHQDHDSSWSSQLADGRWAHVIATERRHGDLSVEQKPPVLDARRRAIVDAPWSWLQQVHGADVVTVRGPGDSAGVQADGVVTTVAGAPICVQVADCAPVAFIDSTGVIGLAHAGWRGLVGGILQATLAAMNELGATAPVAVLGPCIRPASYEFSRADLDQVSAVLGAGVRSWSSDGNPALDVPAGVRAVLDGLGVDVVADIGGCTAEQADRRWSHRARRDPERQSVVAWIT